MIWQVPRSWPGVFVLNRARDIMEERRAAHQFAQPTAHAPANTAPPFQHVCTC